VKTFSIGEERSPNAGLTYSLGSSYSFVKIGYRLSQERKLGVN